MTNNLYIDYVIFVCSFFNCFSFYVFFAVGYRLMYFFTIHFFIYGITCGSKSMRDHICNILIV